MPQALNAPATAHVTTRPDALRLSFLNRDTYVRTAKDGRHTSRELGTFSKFRIGMVAEMMKSRKTPL